MSTSEERGRIAREHSLNHEMLTELARTLKDKNYSNAAIAHILRLSESTVRTMIDENEINWGFNCLTAGVHHGRPEAIWNLPLCYAAQLFPRKALQSLVISRIYNDAMQYVEHNTDGDQITTPEWATRVREIAEESYMAIFQHKIGELAHYYAEPRWKSDQVDAARRNIEDKLNPGYKPLHGHDSINMLCRILGTKASREATG